SDLYSSSEFLISAWNGLRLRHINIDVPISLGIITLLLKSCYDILSGAGPGYVDSMAGLVFFLLIGRVFRQKTFNSLSFDRDYKSFFPLSVIRKVEGREEYISLKKINTGDKLLIRNNEIIPVDSFLLSPSAEIDYSFVSGESHCVQVPAGAKIYAGGIQKGASIEVSAVKLFDQSYITSLWNHEAFNKNELGGASKISDAAAKYFTFIVLAIAFGSLIFWFPKNSAIALNSFIAVLIIACPCAFSLALPFAYGAALRIYGRNSFFLKNSNTVESISKIDSIIFDKTGTLTDLSKSKIDYTGISLTKSEAVFVKSAVKHSTHPLSRLIYQYYHESSDIEIKDFIETAGQGLEADLEGHNIKIGKMDFLRNNMTNCSLLQSIDSDTLPAETTVFLSIDNILKGYFTVKAAYRENIAETLKELLKNFRLYILSGDKDYDKTFLQIMTNEKADLQFNKLPLEKLEFIEMLQTGGRTVMMVGDGLNDAGALKQSNVGIAVTNSESNFTPGSDAIIFSEKIFKLPAFIELAKSSVRTVYISFTISIIYNIAGLSLALQGLLEPIIAAVFMPVSSVSIMLISVFLVKFEASKLKL
ncbi:MAG: P-type Cu+ transporter, partial [Bacteroidota bacterium]|nr:P-type Cu+ transporter [Bacteroidota bacterium]